MEDANEKGLARCSSIVGCVQTGPAKIRSESGCKAALIESTYEASGHQYLETAQRLKEQPTLVSCICHVSPVHLFASPCGLMDRPQMRTSGLDPEKLW